MTFASIKRLTRALRPATRRGSRISGLTVIALSLAWPFLFKGFPTSFMATVWFYAVFAISADLLMGYAGLFSLGHAAFFGVGAYASAIVALNISSNIAVVLVAAIVCAGLAGLIIGLLVIRQSGVYFIMLTFAFAQLVLAIAISWRDVTGGSDGLSGIPAPMIGIGGLTIATLGDATGSYLLCFLGFLAAYAVLRQVVHSPFGLALQGIRENPDRMLALGYAVQRYKLAAVILSAMVAGLAGGLSVCYTRFVSIGDLDWGLSGLVMAMIMMGGMGRLIGAPIGALVILLIQFALGSFTTHWQFVLGTVFVALVLVSVNGIIGLVDLSRAALRERLSERLSGGDAHV